MLNQVKLEGRLTNDPVVKNGGKILSFSVAINEKYVAKNGEEKMLTSFFDIEAVGQSASVTLKKGDTVLIEGKLRQDRWETPSGEKRSKIKIIAFRITPKMTEVQTVNLPEKTENAEATAETKKKTKKSKKAVAT
jgi:single-strand DNA-binding protein